MKAPPALTEQDGFGNPQKMGPCGEDGSETLTGDVTAFAAGQTIEITVDETIYHPGHYRIALALDDPSELPAEPPVTAGNTPCGTVPIMDPPVYPVLADGMLLHSSSFDGPQTISVTLPANVSCEHCTLQILEFMSNHGLNNPGGCFYHHCAAISISAVAATSSSNGSGGNGAGGSVGTGTLATTTGAGAASAGGDGAGGEAGNGGGATTDPGSSGGCGCSVPAGESPALAGIASVLALAELLRRRRRQG